MSDTQQGTAEGLAQGNGHDRKGSSDRTNEWVRREELTAVVAERNELKRKHREVSRQLKQLQGAAVPKSDEQLAADTAAQRLREAEARFERLWVDHQILSAAQAADAVSGPAVVQLLRERVQTRRGEDGRLTAAVSNQDGEPLCDEDGTRLSIGEAVTRFLAEPENAFLVRSRNPGGGGTGSGPRTTPLTPALDQLTAEQIAKLSDSEFERLNEQRRRSRQGFRW